MRQGFWRRGHCQSEYGDELSKNPDSLYPSVRRELKGPTPTRIPESLPMFLASGILLGTLLGMWIAGTLTNPGGRSLVTSSLMVKTWNLLILGLFPEATEDDRILCDRS